MNRPDDHGILFTFDNSYGRLPERFFARLDPTPVRAPKLIGVNVELAGALGLDPQKLSSKETVEIFAGNKVPAGSDPIAMVYAGHQFGGWSPQLGDGRAILLGEILSGDGERFDLQLKGSGRTPFSRSGDGRSALGPVLREYIVSEAMSALGIKTTRALAAVTTGEQVRREDMDPGAVLTRIAKSHVRVGTFEYFAAKSDTDGVQILADYMISRHYPKAARAENPYRALLDCVVKAQAELVASWMQVGFIHGVMNTDNCSITGETIDYGPCAFMDIFESDMVYSSIDHMGRYAYSNQPRIAQWNLAQLAQSLLLLLGDDEDSAISSAKAAIEAYTKIYEEAWLKGMREKLGFKEEDEGDHALIEELLDLMAQNNADFTLSFRSLSNLSKIANDEDEAMLDLFDLPVSLNDWLAQWRKRLVLENSNDAARKIAMRAKNPGFIPRNHLIEEMIQAALQGDLEPFERLQSVLANPFDDQPDAAHYARPPKPHEVVRATFCGT